METSEKVTRVLQQASEPLTAREVAKKSGCSNSYAIRLLGEGEASGELRAIGSRPKRYVLAGTSVDEQVPEQQTLTLLTAVPQFGETFEVVGLRRLDDGQIDVELQSTNGEHERVHLSVAV